ncbi:cytochrome o ubiquinol oxidase subunit IV [Pandoraea terrae]|uniref:Cytochrome bo(3) ubiquinol oxidase subunit 4 n=1 Tax=Pandoraea terrae TaxID=1537710 RepID=A0A5E4UK17_9BURK|nr:cytochrome o ubiquinol oxidase subunit IV [Pandoraea terrae]VVE00024.1 cytochrome o ubiquinol oxidase subunit IV [Pandoraea terrae]
MDNSKTLHAHGHDAHGHNAAGGSHGTVKSYLIGFVLAVILTVIPFKLVMDGSLPKPTILLIILGMALVQIIVHLVYFLHMDRSSEQRWNVMAFSFTVLVVAIVIIGSIWIMHNANALMMIGM